jgi:hypothetical protein
MNTRQLLRTILLGGLAWISLLAVFVFVDEPQPIGGRAPYFHAADAAYLAVPLLLAAAAAYTPLRGLLRELRRERRESSA